MKIFDWLPFARKQHYHGDESLLRYNTCNGCGHLILSSHVSVRRVKIECFGITGGQMFGKSCAPNYNLIKLEPSGVWTAWQNDKAMGKVLCPEGWEQDARIALERSHEGQALSFGLRSKYERPVQGH